jgi:hypothetical protein
MALAVLITGTVVADTAQAQILSLPALETVEKLEIHSRPISSFRALTTIGERFGKLEFRGGLVLTAVSPSFGGWSGLTIDADGRHFMAISDAGAWLSGEIEYRDGSPVGLVRTRIGPIRALKGRALDKKRDLDAESISLLDGTLNRGRVLIGFERNHRIGIFPVIEGALQPPVRYLPLPAEARRMRSNSGFEAVTVLKGGARQGAIVAFAERYPGDTSRHTGWIWVDGRASRLSLADHGGFDVTGAVSLDDGSLVILERRFRWTEGVRMRVRLVAASDIRPGALLDGEILIEADFTSQIDNMEGLAAHRAANGRVILTIISDNNFNTFLQRNLLLQFALVDHGTSASRR